MIYLQKDEDVFVKYGDEEAKLYYEMIEMEKQFAKDHPDQHPESHQGRKGGDRHDKRHPREERHRKDYNAPVSLEEAKQLGLNFREAPPKFNNPKKREHNDDRRQVTDLDNKQQKDLREIIN